MKKILKILFSFQRRKILKLIISFKVLQSGKEKITNRKITALS